MGSVLINAHNQYQQPKPVLSWSLGWRVMPWIHVTADTWSNSTPCGKVGMLVLACKTQSITAY